MVEKSIENNKQECIFCKIAAGEASSYKVKEDEKFLAILDAFPSVKGQVLVIPKEHMGSDISDVYNTSIETFNAMMKFVMDTIDLMKKKLGVEMVVVVWEGMAVKHAHIKLYPVNDVSKSQIVKPPIGVFINGPYPGFTCTAPGPKLSDQELKDMQRKLRF